METTEGTNTMNRRLLTEVAERIAAAPRSYDQEKFGYPLVTSRRKRLLPISECRTPCCVAGHALQITGGPPLGPDETIEDRAAKELDLTQPEQEALFDARWPAGWFTAVGIAPRRGAETDRRPTAGEAYRILLKMARMNRIDIDLTGLRAA